ncbi:MAG: hypothetical protein WA970_03305 [Gammaproteobacteria bacterium]
MPEQITKYPDVTLTVLKGAGARCGEGAPQKILTQCPAERFCGLPTGELCVYGIEEIPHMTQVSTAELAEVVCPLSAKEASLLSVGPEGVLLGLGFILGVSVGRFVRWRR